MPEPWCPLVHVAEIDLIDPSRLEPLLEWLRRGERAAGAIHFPSGVVQPDGRLDLCKQALGPAGLEALLGPLREGAPPHWLLGTNALGDEGAAILAERLAGPGESPATVYLGCNRIGGPGAGRLAEAIASRDAVEALWLKRNPLGLEGARAIARLVGRVRRLRVLDLTNTQLGDEGVALVLSAIVECGCPIEHLYLDANGASERAAGFAARVLASSGSLRSLQLGLNPLGDEGARSIVRGLETSRSLETLGLGSAGLGPAAVAELSDRAGAHPRLSALDLGRPRATRPLGGEPNRLGDEGARHVAAFLRRTRSLRRLDLSGNGITSRGARALALAVGESSARLRAVSLGKGIAESIRRELRAAMAAGPSDPLPAHVAAIRSVYRTIPPRSEDERGSSDRRLGTTPVGSRSAAGDHVGDPEPLRGPVP